MSKLKPCPFCGGKAELCDGRMEFFVRCDNCKPFSLVVYGKSVRELDHIKDEKEAEAAFDAVDWDDIKQSAIDAWNNRPHEEKLKREAFESGFSVTREGFNAEYCGHDYQRFEDAYIAGISIDK